MKFDFSGWATKYGIKCTDGRTIRKNAFAHMDGEVIPLMWNHYDNSPSNVIGKAYLEHRDGEGLYVYGSFNDNEIAQDAKEAVKHGDLTHLSIRANHLKEQAKQVLHGMVREVSLVIAGANSEAVIDTVMAHDDGTVDEIVVEWYPDELEHKDGGNKKFPFKKEDDDEEDTENEDDSKEEPTDDESKDDEEETPKKKKEKKDMQHADGDGEKTVQDVIDSMNEEQQNVLYYLVGQAAEGGDGEDMEHADEDYNDYEEDSEMKHNIFDHETEEKNGVLSHADQLEIIQSAKENRSSLKQAWESFSLSHADDDYGVQDIEWLFPEYQNLNNPPDWIKRDTGWVSIVMNGVHKTPFSRIKSMFADIREDEARAKGYMKGNRKKEEVFSLLKRTTDPQTIYKKQKLDRDDILDITSFDIVAWIKGEMRMMLDEEIARAILIGDGRLASDDDKIHEQHVRSILADDSLYSVKVPITYPAKKNGESDEDFENRVAKTLIRNIIKAKKEYKGSGSPKLFTTENYLTDMLLIEDATGRIIYESVDKLKNTLRVSDIVTVEVMDGATYTLQGTEYNVVGIIVNLQDYNVGADKGGAVSMFEDFDIDYNQEKYLIETRISGALTKPFSALVILEKAAVAGGGSNSGSNSNP